MVTYDLGKIADIGADNYYGKLNVNGSHNVDTDFVNNPRLISRSRGGKFLQKTIIGFKMCMKPTP